MALVAIRRLFGGRSLTELDGTIGKRFGTNHKLGILIGSSYDWNGRGIDDVEPSPTTSQCDASGCDGSPQAAANAPFFPTYNGLDTREYRYYRTRYGLSGSIDYKLGEISGLYIEGLVPFRQFRGPLGIQFGSGLVRAAERYLQQR